MTNLRLAFCLAIFAITLALVVVFERKLIPKLKKRAAQPIFAEGPVWHLSKSGTPTMGGIAFVPAIALALGSGAVFLYFTGDENGAISILLILIFCLLNALIGIVDDMAKIRKKDNAGLSPIEKLLLQLGAATLFIILRRVLLLTSTDVHFTFGTLRLGIFYYPLTLLMLTGTVNSANLTDGIDGIASGVAFAIGGVFAYFSAGSDTAVSIASFCLMGIAVGFLIFNIHPAKIFMGDTGSLLLGAVAASMAVTLGNPFIILFVGGVYLAEAVSVILQVAY